MPPLAHITDLPNHPISWSFSRSDCIIAEVDGRAGKPALPRRSNVANCNGKEKDWESGFHLPRRGFEHHNGKYNAVKNYGARYYWSELLTGWLSVDPMIDSLAYITPYSYCINNPIKLKDNDGNIPIIPIIIGAIEIGTTIYDAIGAGKTLLDNNATPTAKWAAVGGLALDIALPGGGYGAAYRMTSKTIFKIAGKEYRTASEFYKASKKLSIGERMTAYKEMADEVASKEKWVFDKTLSKKTEVAEYILTNLQECITRLIQKKDISRYLIKKDIIKEALILKVKPWTKKTNQENTT